MTRRGGYPERDGAAVGLGQEFYGVGISSTNPKNFVDKSKKFRRQIQKNFVDKSKKFRRQIQKISSTNPKNFVDKSKTFCRQIQKKSLTNPTYVVLVLVSIFVLLSLLL